jgi:hypothetical protein
MGPGISAVGPVELDVIRCVGCVENAGDKDREGCVGNVQRPPDVSLAGCRVWAGEEGTPLVLPRRVGSGEKEGKGSGANGQIEMIRATATRESRSLIPPVTGRAS